MPPKVRELFLKQLILTPFVTALIDLANTVNSQQPRNCSTDDAMTPPFKLSLFFFADFLAFTVRMSITEKLTEERFDITQGFLFKLQSMREMRNGF